MNRTVRSDRFIPMLFRQIVSSFTAYCADVAVLFFLTEVINLYYLISASISFVLGTSITYIFAIKWVFPRRRMKNRRLEYGVYIFIGALGVLFNALLMWFFTEHLMFHYLVSKIFSGLIVFFWNFLSRKYILFR